MDDDAKENYFIQDKYEKWFIHFLFFVFLICSEINSTLLIRNKQSTFYVSCSNRRFQIYDINRHNNANQTFVHRKMVNLQFEKLWRLRRRCKLDNFHNVVNSIGRNSFSISTNYIRDISLRSKVKWSISQSHRPNLTGLTLSVWKIRTQIT